MPPPDVLRSCEDVVPGAAERILVITEDQSKHRMAMEKDAQKGDFRITYLGLATAFTLSLTLIGVGAFTVCIGYAWAGTSIVGVNVAGLAGVFVYGSNVRRAQSERFSDREIPR